jgi:uncharacterized protein
MVDKQQKPKSKRGFASMSPEKQREIASKGGKSVPAEKRSFAQSAALAAKAGQKGGHPPIVHRSGGSIASDDRRDNCPTERRSRRRRLASRGLHIVMPRIAGGYQFRTRPRCAETLRALRREECRPARLTRLEMLASASSGSKAAAFRITIF